MLREMKPRHMREWMLYLNQEPLDPMLALAYGLLSSLYYNANRGKDSKALEPKDFFPQLGRLADAPMTPEQIKRQLILATWKMGGTMTGMPVKPAAPPATSPENS